MAGRSRSRARRDPAEPKPALTEEQAWGKLLAWFAAQAHTRVQTERKLRQWGVDEGLAATLLERLVDLELVDDDAYAEQLAAELVRKGFRGAAISAKLAARGIDRERAGVATHDAQEPVDAFDTALGLARKRVRGARPDAARIAAYLVRRGFSYADAARAANEAMEGSSRSVVEISREVPDS